MCKSALSGIKNYAVVGLDLIINTNDGNQFVMTFPKPADGLNGKSIVNVQIDATNHLICTLDDGTDIDAGEIKGASGGGVIQANSLAAFPQPGKQDNLYLAKDKEKLYYWDGVNYQEITPYADKVLAKLETDNSIVFDDVSDTFDLPFDKISYNVYINGVYQTEGIDYTIDRLVIPNQITFGEIWETTDLCTLTFLKEVDGTGTGGSGGGTNPNPTENLDFVKESDIDNMFGSTTAGPISEFGFVQQADIDNLFDNNNLAGGGVNLMPQFNYATQADIDNIFGGP